MNPEILFALACQAEESADGCDVFADALLESRWFDKRILTLLRRIPFVVLPEKTEPWVWLLVERRDAPNLCGYKMQWIRAFGACLLTAAWDQKRLTTGWPKVPRMKHTKRKRLISAMGGMPINMSPDLSAWLPPSNSASYMGITRETEEA